MTIVRETPGVYIEEITGPGVIQGISTSVAAFVGPTARGTTNRAVEITSFDRFIELFGTGAEAEPHLYTDDDVPIYLSFAIQGFFQNGGQRAYVARVSNGSAAHAELRNDQGGLEALIWARQEGTSGNGIVVTTTPSARSWQLATVPAATVTADGSDPSVSPPNGFVRKRSIQLSNDPTGFVPGDRLQISSVPQPTVANPGDQTSVIGETVSLRVIASPATGQALSFTATGLPGGLAIDSTTGRITGQPTAGGTSSVQITVTEVGQSSTVAFTWSVREARPQVTSPGDQVTAVNASVTLQIQATAEQGGTLQYTANRLPTGLTIDQNSGAISGTPTADEYADVAVDVTEDGGPPETTRFSWIVGTPNEPTVVNPGDQDTAVGGDVDLAIIATAAGGGALSYAANTLPAGLAIDPNTGRITGQPTATGSNNVQVTVTEAGQSSTIQFTWTVRWARPNVTPPPDKSTSWNTPVNLQIQAAAEVGGTLTYSANGLPPGLTIDSVAGLISGTPTARGFWDVSIDVTEGAGGGTTIRFTWTVPETVVAQVARAEKDWVMVSSDLSTSFRGRPVRMADLPPSENRVRVIPDQTGLPDVGTWVAAGGGAETLTFRIERVETATTFVTIGGTPRTQDLTHQRHGTLSSLSFALGIAPPTGAAESFAELSVDPISPNYLLNAGVVDSQYVVLEEPVQPLFSLPRTFGPGAPPVSLTGGAPFDPETISVEDYQDALALLDTVDAVNMVCVPDAARYDGADRVIRQAIQAAQLRHCLAMADRIAIFDPPKHPDDPGNNEGDVIDNVILDVRSERGFGALYHPWLQILDPRVTPPRPPMRMSIPPSGHVAGVIARTDTQRGVSKAPANVTISEVLDVDRRLTDADQGPLNMLGVNVLRVLPGSNRVNVWGARTTVDPYVTDWLYLNVRRLLLFIEESIQDGIRWAVFEPNATALWKALERVIRAFLREQWRAGALFGEEEDQAFRVRIDEALNPPSTRNKGYLYIEVKVAPVRPAEFIVVRISLFDGGTDVEEA